MPDLDALFWPGSIASIGASPDISHRTQAGAVALIITDYDKAAGKAAGRHPLVAD